MTVHFNHLIRRIVMNHTIALQATVFQQLTLIHIKNVLLMNFIRKAILS